MNDAIANRASVGFWAVPLARFAAGRRGVCSYCPTSADRLYDERRTRCQSRRRLAEGSALLRFVYDHLVHPRWSPEQIAQRLRVMKPDDPSARLSYEAIYAAIYAQPRGGLKAAMVEALQQTESARGRRLRGRKL